MRHFEPRERPMMHPCRDYCDIEIHINDLGAYEKAFYEEKLVSLPHGDFLPESYYIHRIGLVSVYCRRVQRPDELFELK